MKLIPLLLLFFCFALPLNASSKNSASIGKAKVEKRMTFKKVKQKIKKMKKKDGSL